MTNGYSFYSTLLTDGLRFNKTRLHALATFFIVLASLALTAFAAEDSQKSSDTIAALLGRPLPLEWRLDPIGKMSVADVLAHARGNGPSFFEPIDAGPFPHSAGSVWFRFQLPSYEGRSFYLDLNTRIAGHIPEGSQVWLVRTAKNPGNAEPLPQLSPGLFQLPNASPAPAAIYLRTNGVPSPGFSPTLRESADLSSVELDGLFWPCLALSVCLLLSFLRGIIERREWRLWSSFYIAAALTTLFWGVPYTPQGLPMPQNLPALLAPGIALLLLPHVGRQLFRSRDNAPGIDLTLILTGMLGLALGLAPLLPRFGWTVRLLPLWPLGLCLLWPTALLAAARKLPGAKGFALAVLLPPLGFLPLLFSGFPGSFGIIKLLPAMAICAGALMLLLTPTPIYDVFQNRRGGAVPAGGKKPHELTLLPAPDDNPEDDEPGMSPFQRQLATLSEDINALASSPVQGAIIEKLKLLVKAIEDVEASPIASTRNEKEGFSLHQVVLEAHNAVLDKAEKKNLALSWYMAPQLSRRYLANRNALARVLKLLLESSVQATERGTVHLRVQRMPESNDPGQVMFTISDTGAGAPPFGRDTAAFCLAWELATRQGGGISLTSGASGTTVVLAVRMQPAGESPANAEKKRLAAPLNLQASMTGALRVLIVSDIPASRQLLAYYLDELPHELLEARGTAEALAIYTQRPGSLVIFDGDLPEGEVAKAIANLRDFEGTHDLPPAALIALSNSEAQAERLRHAGCTLTLENPVSRTILRRLVLRLAPPPNTRASSRAFPGGAVFPLANNPTTFKTRSTAAAPSSPAKEAPSPSAPQKQDEPAQNSLPATSLSQGAPVSQNSPVSQGAPLAPQPETPSTPARQPETAAPDVTAQQTGDALHFLRPAAFDVRSNVGDPKPIVRSDAREDAFAAPTSGAGSGEPSATEPATPTPKETAAEATGQAPKTMPARVTLTAQTQPSETPSTPISPAEQRLHTATPAARTRNPKPFESGRTEQTTPPPARKGTIPYTETAPANQPAEQTVDEPAEPMIEKIAPRTNFFSSLFGMFRRKPRFSAKELGLTAGHTSCEWVGDPVPIVKESPIEGTATPEANVTPKKPAETPPVPLETARKSTAFDAPHAGAPSNTGNASSHAPSGSVPPGEAAAQKTASSQPAPATVPAGTVLDASSSQTKEQPNSATEQAPRQSTAPTLLKTPPASRPEGQKERPHVKTPPSSPAPQKKAPTTLKPSEPVVAAQKKAGTPPGAQTPAAKTPVASPLLLLPPLPEETPSAQPSKDATLPELAGLPTQNSGKDAPLELTELAAQVGPISSADAVAPATKNTTHKRAASRHATTLEPLSLFAVAPTEYKLTPDNANTLELLAPVLPAQPAPRAKNTSAMPDNAPVLPPQDEENGEGDGIEIEALLGRLGKQEESLRTAREQQDYGQLRHIAAEMALIADALSLPNLADLSRCIEQEENEDSLVSLVDSALDAAKEARG